MPDSDAELKWLIEARRNIQLALLALHTLAERHPADLKGEHLAAFSTLTSAAFSLWRAAFLADIKQERAHVFNAAKELLNELLTANAVPFSMDKKLQNWMFGYYLQNAVERLARAKGMLGPNETAFAELDWMHQHGLFDIGRTPKELWSTLHAALVMLSDSLKQRVESESATGPLDV